MNGRRLRLLAALLAAVGTAFMAFAAKASPALMTRASAAALIESETGRLLAAKNEDLMLPMASTTKIMTALVVLENCSADDIVKVPAEAVGVEGSSVYLEEGEEISVGDLLYGLMLASGNDAAVALAVHTAGSVSAFADMMNSRAEDMGLTRTHFITPNGLHDERHLTTARELCLITREALKVPEFREIVSTKYHTAQSGSRPRTFKNKNSLLWEYDGAFGVKTGYTMAAGRCLVFGAERDGMTVIGALLNCRPMFETAVELMDGAFESWEKRTLVSRDQQIGGVFIENGTESILEVRAKDSIIDVAQSGAEHAYTTSALIRDGLAAPISRGEVVGELSVWDGDVLVGRADLVAAYDVGRKDLRYWWQLLIKRFAA
ncbi:MAG: D-alanyl-D-alanine carboxypeptidase [Clostridia bacterium]|nr:D-alanyl-D-alanine carboxypeptidase [Clostridia bacterium]